MSPAVIASVPDLPCAAVKSSVATATDLVNSIPVLAPTTGPPILEVCPEKFTSIDYDAVVDAPIALYPWQPEDDACLRQLVGSGPPDSHINWQAMAAHFNQKRGAGDQQTEWLQRPREQRTGEQAPIARTETALQARWGQLQKQGKGIAREGVKCSICDFVYTDLTCKDADRAAGENGGFICEFCDSTDEDDVFSTSWAMHADTADDSFDTTESLDTMELDEDGWDALEDGSAAGAEGSLAECRRPGSKNRKQFRFSTEDFSKEVSSDDEPGKAPASQSERAARWTSC